MQNYINILILQKTKNIFQKNKKAFRSPGKPLSFVQVCLLVLYRLVKYLDLSWLVSDHVQAFAQHKGHNIQRLVG